MCLFSFYLLIWSIDFHLISKGNINCKETSEICYLLLSFRKEKGWGKHSPHPYDYSVINYLANRLEYQERKKIEAWKQIDQPLSNRTIAKSPNCVPQTTLTKKDRTVRQIKRKMAKHMNTNHLSHLQTLDKQPMNRYERIPANTRYGFLRPISLRIPIIRWKRKSNPRCPRLACKKLNLLPYENFSYTTILHNYNECFLFLLFIPKDHWSTVAAERCFD